MARVCLISVYLGPLPRTFDFFLRTCAENPEVHFLLACDAAPAAGTPENVQFLPMTAPAFSELASHRLGLDLHLSHPRKLCDYKPLYGLLFAEYLEAAEFWGFCDLDVLWGDLSSWLSGAVLDEYDLITADARRVSGPFTILRNEQRLRALATTHPDFESVIGSPAHHAFDEIHFDDVVKRMAAVGELRCLFAERGGRVPAMQNYGHDAVDAHPSRVPCTWDRGRLFVHAHGAETMMLHLLGMTESLVLDTQDAFERDKWIVTRDAILPWPLR